MTSNEFFNITNQPISKKEFEKEQETFFKKRNIFQDKCIEKVMSWIEYENELFKQDFYKHFDNIENSFRLNTSEYNLEEFNADYGDIFTINDFKKYGFSDYDGSGRYAKKVDGKFFESDIPILPSDKIHRPDFDYVIWYNK